MVLRLRLLRGVQIIGRLTHSSSTGSRIGCLEATSAAIAQLQLAASSTAFSSSSSSSTSTSSWAAPSSNQYLGTSSNVMTAGNTEQQQRQHQQQQQRGFQGLPDWQQQLRRSNVVWNNHHHHHHHHQQQLHYSAPNICTTHVSHWRERQQQQQCVLLTLVQGLRHSHQQHRCYHQDKQQQQQQQQQRWETQHAIPSKSPLTAAEAAKAAEGFQQQQQQQQVPGSSWTSLPNLLSLSRVMSGPWAAYLVATQQWPLAFALTAAAAATDWADGYLARRLGHTSKLGSYLDPLGDKVLVASVVGTMGWNGMLPAWLAVLVVGRDTAQVCGMFVYRLKMFRGRWPGAAAFFDVDAAMPQQQQQQRQQNYVHVEGVEGVAGKAAAASSSSAAEATAGEGGGLPSVKPLMVSKVNTALVLLLIAGCMTQQWQGLPGQHVLDAIELGVAGTTAASAAAYARLYWTGRLLANSKV